MSRTFRQVVKGHAELVIEGVGDGPGHEGCYAPNKGGLRFANPPYMLEHAGQEVRQLPPHVPIVGRFVISSLPLIA